MTSIIRIRWNYGFVDNDGFLLQRSTDYGVTWPLEFAITSSTATLYSDVTNLDGIHSYRVAATNAFGTGSFSNTGSILIPSRCLSSSFASQYFADSLKTWLTYDLEIPAPPASDIVTNGGFETGDFTGWTVVDASTSTTVESTPSYVHDGVYGVQAGPWQGNQGTITQTVPTTAGNGYTIGFWMDSSGGSTLFQVKWEGSTVLNLDGVVAAWTYYTVPVTATTNGSQLQFYMQNEPAYFGLDTITVN
jgi:hypothetical protein